MIIIIVIIFLSQSHSAYRKGTSASDTVWAHRWLIAKVSKYRVMLHILGIDMSRAFDTINRTILLNILESIRGMRKDSLRLIRVLLANTSLKVKVNGIMSESFTSNIGSPQGDALSPI